MGSLYVNAHSDVNFDDMAQALKETNFFNVLMDGSTIHNKEKEAVYIQYFQEENFIKGDPTKTVLFHLAEPGGISVNATKLKNCLIKSLKILEPYYNFDALKQKFVSYYNFDALKQKFVSICTDGASTNIGCNNSLYAQLLEDYPHLLSFWCICHRLELAIKDAIGNGLLSDIKECLLRLYYLYNKSSKKLRSLEELIKDLEGLIALQDSCIEDEGIAPMKACGTRWIGHLVNALQRAINKFGVYLKDLDNMAEDDTTKKPDSPRLFGYLKQWQDYRYLLGMGFFLHLLIPLKMLSLGWQKDYVCAVEQEQKLEKALKNINLLKGICEKGRCLELPYIKMILDNTNEDGEYQTFPFKYVERAKTTIENNAVVWCDKVLECIQKRFDGNGNKKIVDAANQILNCSCWEIEADFETMKRASGDNSNNDESTDDDSEYDDSNDDNSGDDDDQGDEVGS